MRLATEKCATCHLGTEAPASTGVLWEFILPESHMSEVQSLPDQIERIDHAITAVDLAHLLGVSRATIFKQAAAGRIPAFGLGTCVRFDPKAVANWLRKM
jgi:excisionase family DNA binding protein